MTETVHRVCTLCEAHCGIRVEVEGEQVVRISGDPDDVMSRGYMCVKGRQLIAQHEHPERLRGSRKRLADGSLVEISNEQALDEIAAQLERIIARDGPQAVALYAGYSLLGNGTFGRVVAYLWAVLVIVNSFLVMAVAPWFAFTMIALAVLVVYGLASNPKEASA